MTAHLEAELRFLLGVATPAPWRVTNDGGDGIWFGIEHQKTGGHAVTVAAQDAFVSRLAGEGDGGRSDAALVVALRNAAAAILDELARLRLFRDAGMALAAVTELPGPEHVYDAWDAALAAERAAGGGE